MVAGSTRWSQLAMQAACRSPLAVSLRERSLPPPSVSCASACRHRIRSISAVASVEKCDQRLLCARPFM